MMAESIETSDIANKSFYSNVFVLLFIDKFKLFYLVIYWINIAFVWSRNLKNKLLIKVFDLRTPTGKEKYPLIAIVI